jgi:hypothetical protein
MFYTPYNLNTKNIVIKKQIYSNLYPIKYKYSDQKISNFIFQTPTMYIPFGITEFNSNKYIDISFMNLNNYNNIEELKTFIETITTYFKYKIKNYIYINSLKESSVFYPPLLRLNFTNSNEVLVFNEDNEKIDNTYIKPKTYGKFIIQLSNLWVNKNTRKFGLLFNIAQIKLYVNLTYIPKTLEFIDDTSNTNYNIDKNTITYKEKYSKYFTMLNRGIPLFAVKQKLLLDNLDQTIIDTPNKLFKTGNSIKINHLEKLNTNKNVEKSIFSQIKLGSKLNKTIIISKSIKTKEKIIEKYKSDSHIVPSKSAILFAKQNLKTISIL